jgi:hypothetical protein
VLYILNVVQNAVQYITRILNGMQEEGAINRAQRGNP